MDKRILAFEAFSAHPWLKRVYNKLTPEDRWIARDFLAKNAQLEKGPFEYAVNRMFLDRPKPKHYKEILELLTCANSTL